MKRSKEVSRTGLTARPETGILFSSIEPVMRLRKGDLFRVASVFGLKVELMAIDLSCLSSLERQKLLKMEEKDARVETLPVGRELTAQECFERAQRKAQALIDKVRGPNLPDTGT